VGTGIPFGRHAPVAAWLHWVLFIITGYVDRVGGMRFTPHLSDAALAHPAPPMGSVQPGPASRPELAGLLGQRRAGAIVDEIEGGELRALIVAGGNPLSAFPIPIACALH